MTQGWLDPLELVPLIQAKYSALVTAGDITAPAEYQESMAEADLPTLVVWPGRGVNGSAAGDLFWCERTYELKHFVVPVNSGNLDENLDEVGALMAKVMTLWGNRDYNASIVLAHIPRLYEVTDAELQDTGIVVMPYNEKPYYGFQVDLVTRTEWHTDEYTGALPWS